MLERLIQQMEKQGYLVVFNKDQEARRFTGKLDYYYQLADFLMENESGFTVDGESDVEEAETEIGETVVTATTPVSELLANLHRCHQTVSDAFYDASILKTAENEREIGLLRHWRMLSPDVRDTYRIRGSLRQFLNTVISTVRLYAVGANIGEHFGRISKLIDEHAYAYNLSGCGLRTL